MQVKQNEVANKGKNKIVSMCKKTRQENNMNDDIIC